MITMIMYCSWLDYRVIWSDIKRYDLVAEDQT